MRLWRAWVLLPIAVPLAGQQYPFLPVPHSPRNIEHILEDRQGRLWISTHDDVLCFDGAHFFSLHDFGLPSVFSTSLTEDADGGILSASASGIYRFFRGRLEHVLSGVSVFEAIGGAPGVLLAATFPNRPSQSMLIYRVRATASGWKAEPLPDWKSGQFLTRDAAGAILNVCPGGWCETAAVQTFHPSAVDMERVLRDRRGCLWFRSEEGGAYRCPGDPRPVPLPAAVAGRNVWAAIRENDDGSMLFASVGSVAVGRPGAFQVVTPANGLPAESVSCALRARDGSIWVGTLGGLYRFPYPFRMTYWKSRYGLIWSFARWHGKIVAGTSAGVAELNAAGEWKVLPGSREFGSVSSLLPDPDGSLYAAVSREAVIQLRADGTLEARTPPQRGGQAQTLARTANGDMFAAGSVIYRVLKKGHELSLLEQTRPATFGTEAFLESDSAGGVWGCAEDHVVHWRGGKWEKAERDPTPQAPCRALSALPNGDLWIGKNVGLILVRSGILQSQDGGDLGHPTGYFFGWDTRGRLWRGAGDGVYVARPEQAASGRWLHLTESDGLTILDVNHGSFFLDTDGTVWWSAATNIVHFAPPDDLIPSAAPAVFLSAYSVNDAPPELAEKFAQLPDGKRLIAHLGTLQLRGRASLRVRYRLLPQQKEWRESSTLDLDLGKPWWGAHTLEVQSRFSTGPWSHGWSRSLIVLRPWWLSWTSVLAFAGIGFGGTAGSVAWKRKKKARAAADLPDLASWRMTVLSPESQWVGKTLERRFQVHELVARGGFATVLRGRDLGHGGRSCAIKIFRREIVDDQWLAHRFRQEVSALQQIHDPSVVTIYGHGVTPDGAPYLVMEFIEGGTLRDLLEAGPLPPMRSASLLRQVAGALEQIHARGIYHRDLKPENLMLRTGAGEGQELVLIDFSIAIVKEPDQTIHGLSRAAGTIYYMAPEQAVGFATPASDVYSLAKVVLEMLTGHRLSALLPNASMDLPERVRELVRKLAVPLSGESIDLLGSALEFDPARRPQSADAFSRPIVRDLSAVSSGPSANPSPYPKGGGPDAGSDR